MMMCWVFLIFLNQKQQSEEQRLKQKLDLERKRLEAYDREKRPAPLLPRPHSAVDQQSRLKAELNNNNNKPVEPPVNVTEVLSAIGVVGKKM